MPNTTQNLQLKTYNSAADSQEKFLTFRTDIAGEQNSNMTKIDTWAGEVNTSLKELGSMRPIIRLNAIKTGVGAYEITTDKITQYETDLIVVFIPNANNDGTTTIKVNSLGVKTIMKYGTDGAIKNLDTNDLRINHEYILRYDADRWILVNSTGGDQINIPNARTGNILSVDANGNIIDSGVQSNKITEIGTSVGDTSILTTTSKEVVGAINEIDDEINDLLDNLGVPFAEWLDNPDYDTLIDFQRYRIGGGTNSPGGGVWYLEVNPVQSGIVFHRAKCVYGGNIGQVKERVLKDGQWDKWDQIATTTKTDILVTPTNGLKVAGNKVSFVEEIAGIKIYHGELVAEAPITGSPVVLTLPNFTSTTWRAVTFVNQNTKENYSGWCYHGGIVRINLPAGQYQVDISYT